MKKNIVFSILFVSLFLFKTQDTFASEYNVGFGQVEPCDQYWWPGIAWHDHIYKVIEIDGCFYLISYWHREIPTGRQEYQITEFARLQPPNCTVNRSFDEIKKWAYIQIFEEAGKALLDFYQVGFPTVIQENICKVNLPYIPDPNGPILNPYSVDSLFVTIPIGTISIDDSILISPYIPTPSMGNYRIGIDQYFVYCPDTVCCRAFYLPFFNPNDPNQIDSMFYDGMDEVTYQGPDTCKAQYCEENCGSLEFNYDRFREAPFFKDGPFAKTINNHLNLDGSLELYPNPTNGIIQLVIENEARGRAILEIVDLEGHTLVEEFHEKNDEILKIKLNLSNFIKGAYFVKFSVNGQIIKKKFLIK